jgi:acetyl-CoA carboxylase carboxyl transferase subunit alpha
MGVAALQAGAACARPTYSSSRQGQQSGLGQRNVRPLQSSLQARQPRRLSVAVAAKGKAGDPPDVPKPRDQRAGGREWLQSILSRFGPVKERASNTTVLDFEKPLVELDNRIKEVRPGGQGDCRQQAAAHEKPCHMRRHRRCWAGLSQTLPALLLLQVRQVAEENGVDVSNQIKELEERAKQVSTQLQPPPLPWTAWPVLPECCLQRAAARALRGAPSVLIWHPRISRPPLNNRQ